MSEETAGSSTPDEAPDGSTTPDAGRTYTQEELDRIVTQRVQKSKAQFKNFDEYKQAAEQLEKMQSERQTDLEKAMSRAERAEAKARAEAQQREELMQQLQENTVRSEVYRSAATAEIGLDVDDVFRLIDRNQVTVTDTGEVRGVSEAIKKLAEKYPKRTTTGGFDGGARQVVREGTTSADFSARLRREAGFA